MSASRRHFLSMLAAAGTVPLWPAVGSAATQAGQPGKIVVDEDTLRFWTKQVRSPQTGALTRGASAGEENRHPEFTVFNKSKGFRSASQISDSELLDQGDVNVSLRVLAFKPSAQDQAEFANIQTGSLRIDFQQAKSKTPSGEPLVWTAFAGVQPDAKGKLPSLENTGFNPGTAWGKQQVVPLPGGAGLWAWNFFVQKRESIWCQVVSSILGNLPKVAPILGFPALALGAMDGFNQFFGMVVAKHYKSKFLFRTLTDPAVATKDARQDAQYADGLPLADQTHYVVVPREQYRAFGEQMSKYEVQSGVVVPQGTKPHEVFEAATTVLKDVTYLTLAVSVKPT